MTSFRKFNVGDKLRPTAAQVNAWTEAAISHKQSKKHIASSLEGKMHSASRVMVTNNTGGDLPAFSVLQISGSSIDPEVNEDEYLNVPALEGEEVTEDGTGKFVIIQQYLGDESIDQNSVISGITYARLTGDIDQDAAYPKSGQTTLESGSSGACAILYDPGPADEERTAIVRIGTASPTVKRGIISQIGDYDIHLVTIISGTFSDSLTTDSLEHTRSEVQAYVAEEFEQQHFNIGDIVTLAQINGKYWIVQKKDGCEGYCVHPDLEGDGYIYGWTFRAPNLPCCPEAGGIHILTTSDSGVTYQSSTFQCNEDGTDRKWIYTVASKKLRISPMLDLGNLEYRTDSTPEACTVQLQQYEQQLYPNREDCGKLPKSVCLHPLCGVGTCSHCSTGLSPMAYRVVIGGGGSANPDYVGSNPYEDECSATEADFIVQRRVIEGGVSAGGTHCVWSAPYGTTVGNYGGLGLTDYSFDMGELALSIGLGDLRWEILLPTDCTQEMILELYDEGENPYCVNLPQTITVTPIDNQTLEGNCYPVSVGNVATIASGNICNTVPYYMEFEISGLTDGTCNECNTLNDLHRLKYWGGLYGEWTGDSMGTACSFDYGQIFVIRTLHTLDQIWLFFGSDSHFGTQYNARYTMDPADWNCNGPNVFDYDSDSGDCDNWPATITAYPVVDTD